MLHHPFCTNNKTIGGGSRVDQLMSMSIQTFSTLTSFFSHQKASAHSTALDLSNVLIYSITVTELW